MKNVWPAAVTILFWSSSFAGIKQGLEGYSPGHFVLLRFLTASLVFCVLSCFKLIHLPKKEDIVKLFILAVLGITIYHTCLTFGETVVQAGTAGLLIASVPAFTAVFSYLLFKERLSFMGWAGIIVGFLGTVVICVGNGKGFSFTGGAILILIASLSTTFFFIYQKPFFKKYGSVELTAYFTWFGTIPMLIFIPDFFTQMSHVPIASTLSGVYLGILPSAFAYITWSLALARSSASVVASSLYIEPILAVLIAWAWINEKPGLVVLAGGLITILGVIMVSFFGKEKVHIQERKAG